MRAAESLNWHDASRASGWGVLLAGIVLDEVAEFAQNLAKQLGIEWMLAGVSATDIVASRAKVLRECGLHRCDDVAVLAVSLKSLLFGEHRANRDELKRAALRVKTAVSDVAKQHICACLWP